MSRTLQFKRYANTVVANTTGASGEIIIDTTNKLLTIHDGVTPGGFGSSFDSVARASACTAQTTAQAAYNSANTTSNNIIILQGVNATQNTNITAAAQTVPQNAQSNNYTLQLTDAGKHIYYTQASNTILYIPTTANVAFSNGTTIMVVSRTSSSANVTVSPNTGVSMYLAGNTTNASRNVTTHGVVTLISVAANTWFISGTGVV